MELKQSKAEEDGRNVPRSAEVDQSDYDAEQSTGGDTGTRGRRLDRNHERGAAEASPCHAGEQEADFFPLKSLIRGSAPTSFVP